MKGILIINLGTPDKPEKKEVKSYLGEFLMDEYVIDLPYIARWLLVKGVILNTRPKRSAAAYKKVWNEKGSPLMYHSVDLVEKVKALVDMPVELGMRYNKPSINTSIQNLKNKGCTEIFVIPLYPQYAMSSFKTVVEKVKKEAVKIDPSIKLDFIEPFYKEENFIKLWSDKVKEEKEKSGAEYVLFSYHSIPVNHLEKTDGTGIHCNKVANCCEVKSKAHETCYKHQCIETTMAIVKNIGLKPEEFEIAYQSKLGRKEWITPATASRIDELPQEGKKNIMVVVPSFVSDCLETIEEIGIEGREEFMEHGGEKYHRVDCLNSDDNWANVLADWIKNN
jgi:ferrochelatase